MVVMSSGQYCYCSLVLTGARVDHNLRHVYLIPLSTCSSPSLDCPYSSMVYVSLFVLLSFSLFVAAADLYKILDSEGPDVQVL